MIKQKINIFTLEDDDSDADEEFSFDPASLVVGTFVGSCSSGSS